MAVQTTISVDEARSIISDAAVLQPIEDVELSASLGRTMAEAAACRDDIPAFDNSAMDGYAVRAADLASVPVQLAVIEDVPAGRPAAREVSPGTSARIMTGAPMPPGADTVVPVELTDAATNGRVVILEAVPPGANVRRAGADLRSGEVVVAAGTIVTPPVVGVLASMGFPSVPVRKAPCVAVVTTGDELVGPGEELGPGHIRDSNGPALAAQVTAAGGVCLPPLHAPDDRAAIRRAVERALAADVLVFAGGVSVGDYDFVKEVLDDAGFDLRFWKVRQRPGKPLAFGSLREKPVFGLPGNPVSAGICFDQYVRPTLGKMLGRTEVFRPRLRAVLAAGMKKVAGLHYFARGVGRYTADGSIEVRPAGSQASNVYSTMIRANCIVHLPEEMEDPSAGTSVEIEWLTW